MKEGRPKPFYIPARGTVVCMQHHWIRESETYIMTRADVTCPFCGRTFWPDISVYDNAGRIKCIWCDALCFYDTDKLFERMRDKLKYGMARSREAVDAFWLKEGEADVG